MQQQQQQTSAVNVNLTHSNPSNVSNPHSNSYAVAPTAVPSAGGTTPTAATVTTPTAAATVMTQQNMVQNVGGEVQAQRVHSHYVQQPAGPGPAQQGSLVNVTPNPIPAPLAQQQSLLSLQPPLQQISMAPNGHHLHPAPPQPMAMAQPMGNRQFERIVVSPQTLQHQSSNGSLGSLGQQGPPPPHPQQAQAQPAPPPQQEFVRFHHQNGMNGQILQPQHLHPQFAPPPQQLYQKPFMHVPSPRGPAMAQHAPPQHAQHAPHFMTAPTQYVMTTNQPFH